MDGLYHAMRFVFVFYLLSYSVELSQNPFKVITVRPGSSKGPPVVL